MTATGSHGDGPRVVALGTSAAWPVPRPGCGCRQCEEARADPARARTRTALLVEGREAVVLVDAGPDVARQLERRGGPPRVDRVVLTHTHADHVLGLDDVVHLRAPGDGPLGVHAAEPHRARVEAMFPSLVRRGKERIAFLPWGDGVRIEAGGAVLEGFETGHRPEIPTTAPLIRLGDRRILWASDMGDLPASSRTRLVAQGVDLFVGDGTYLGGPGYGHPGTDVVREEARRVGAREVALTHVGHVGLGAEELAERLGPGVRLLWDGDVL